MLCPSWGESKAKKFAAVAEVGCDWVRDGRFMHFAVVWQVFRHRALGLLRSEDSYGTACSVVYTRRAGGLHGVVVGGLRIKSGNAHPENHVRMGSVAPIGRFGDVSQVHGVGAIAHDAVVQVGSSGLRGGPVNDC